MPKPTKWLCVQWRQISLGIRPVWSVFTVGSVGSYKDPRFFHVDIEDWSDRADAQADLSVC